MAIPLGRPLPAASCNQPGRRPGEGWEIPVVPIRSCSRRGLPCRRRRRRRGALLPHPFTLAFGEPKAVCFLWRFPWGRPRRTLSGAVSPWSPDFPPPVKAAAIRPTGGFAITAMGAASSLFGVIARAHPRISGVAPETSLVVCSRMSLYWREAITGRYWTRYEISEFFSAPVSRPYCGFQPRRAASPAGGATA